MDLRGKRFQKGCPHSPWELLEHLRIAQWDILEFSRNGKHFIASVAGGLLAKGASETP